MFWKEKLILAASWFKCFGTAESEMVKFLQVQFSGEEFGNKVELASSSRNAASLSKQVHLNISKHRTAEYDIQDSNASSYHVQVGGTLQSILASIAVPTVVQSKELTYDHKGLYEMTKVATKSLNKVIDRNYYPIPEARHSNMKHRPIGSGVQGLADAFISLRYAFECEPANMVENT